MAARPKKPMVPKPVFTPVWTACMVGASWSPWK